MENGFFITEIKEKCWKLHEIWSNIVEYCHFFSFFQDWILIKCIKNKKEWISYRRKRRKMLKIARKCQKMAKKQEKFQFFLFFSSFFPFFPLSPLLFPFFPLLAVLYPPFLAEWLRRWTRNSLRSSRVALNPTGYACIFTFFGEYHK